MANKAPEQRITKARTRLLINSPFFGTLALRLKITKDSSVPTFANDGTTLLYNEEFLNTLTDTQLQAVLAHEVMHCAMGHMFRAGNRNFTRWNIAGDYAINLLLRDEKFDLPPGLLIDEKYRNMSAEQIYPLLPDNGQHQKSCICGLQPGGGPVSDKKDSSESSGSSDNEPGQSNSYKMTEAEWQILAQQAADSAKKNGRLPANLDRLITLANQPRVDWRSILRRFITQTVPSDYSWAKPNRRFISQGLYLPGMMKENAPRIGVAVDTSGSIDQQLLSIFASEITAIIHEVRPEQIDVLYCDTQIQSRDTFTPDDSQITLNARGGGGTSFEPPFIEFNENPPACVIYLTDGYASWPKQPDYPVLWAITEESHINEVPWGEFVKISKHD